MYVVECGKKYVQTAINQQPTTNNNKNYEKNIFNRIMYAGKPFAYRPKP